MYCKKYIKTLYDIAPPMCYITLDLAIYSKDVKFLRARAADCGIGRTLYNLLGKIELSWQDPGYYPIGLNNTFGDVPTIDILQSPRASTQHWKT